MITITPKLAGLVAASAFMLMAPTALAASGPHKPHKTPAKSTKPAKKTAKAAAWSFPGCAGAAPEYEYIYSGDPCTSTSPATGTWKIEPAPESEDGVLSQAPVSQQNGTVCNGNDEYDYLYSGCQS